jgi:phenol 2-monooxygenase (NADPH)
VVATFNRGSDDTNVTVRARYVVGCDGARSRVRTAIGRRLSGDSANHAWGVMDVLARTDFPDVRLKTSIQTERGSILLIPREGGYLVRLYVDLGPVTSGNREEIRAMGAQEIVHIANKVLHPYTLEMRETIWCSVYEVAQRIADAFDDAVDRARQPHVFIAGDACHTHSAKAGQGMNVSMQDAFNLGWKLAAVLESRSDPQLLTSYDAERRPIAQELIDFDRDWSAMLSAPSLPSSPSAEGVVPDPVSEYFVRNGRYTAGVAARYTSSPLTGSGVHQHLAAGYPVGMRFHSAPVIRIADSKRVELGHAATADGRWRLYAFADESERRFRDLAEWILSAPASPIAMDRARGRDLDASIDVRGILQRPAHDVVLADLPGLLLPVVGVLGLVDYEKAFAADQQTGADIFDLRGVDREQGSLILVRPDQYVADVLPLDAFPQLTECFQVHFRMAEGIGRLAT